MDENQSDSDQALVSQKNRSDDIKLHGAALIADMVTKLPNSPGVYRMFNEQGDVLYVGKARSLKNRVQSYARGTGHSNRIARMISQTASMEFVTTKTETEALLLEANMIKQLRPRYNVLLRDDKSFPYILIAKDHEAPQILKHRGARKRDGKYFGPFASAGAVNRTLNALQRAFLLRSCSDSVYDSRSRPCLLYQIKRCSAPCTGEISLEDYKELVDDTHKFLSGRSQAVRDDLVSLMQKSSDNLDFERAAIYRDRLAALSHVQSQQGINLGSQEDADIFAVHQAAGQNCVQVFFFRAGQNWGNRAYFPRADKSLEAGEVLGAFLAQFYDDKPSPGLILLSEDIPDQDLLAEALTARAERKVTISIPKRGEKKQVTDHALTNAKEALGRRLSETSAQDSLLTAMAKAFGLEDVPRRIEVYDNSHIQGTNAVGGMIVAGPDGFSKAHYRKFNIKSEELTPGDDYGMMKEVLTRRFKRLIKESDNQKPETDSEEFPDWPDIVLIDGGAGQLSAVREVFDELGVANVTLIAIAKGPDRDAGRERFFMPDREPFMLQAKDPVLYYVQRLRDEAHRFAIGSHRARRKKSMGRSPLDEIEGIGPSRKRSLLNYFGSAKAVSNAGIADLQAVEGISEQTARVIYDFFHENS